jgi:hypothetical protein
MGAGDFFLFLGGDKKIRGVFLHSECLVKSWVSVYLDIHIFSRVDPLPMHIPDEWVGALLVGLIILVLGQLVLSCRAYYQYKEEVRDIIDGKIGTFATSLENVNAKIENCNIRIENIYARLESFENKYDLADKELWSRADQIERRLQDKNSQLREELLALRTTSELLMKAGLLGSEGAYKKQRGED